MESFTVYVANGLLSFLTRDYSKLDHFKLDHNKLEHIKLDHFKPDYIQVVI